MTTRRAAAALLGALALSGAGASSQGAPSFPTPPFQHELLSERTVRVSKHVWAIIGFPNVAIVVGGQATLVVDTGLGRRNGATVARVAKRLAPRNQLYVTTTHFHPEHVAGVLGFPPGTRLIRNQVQQDELDRYGEDMIRLFAGQNAQWEALLADEQLRAPDEIFSTERRLDLGGGVTARLLWFGPTHTRGDELGLRRARQNAGFRRHRPEQDDAVHLRRRRVRRTAGSQPWTASPHSVRFTSCPTTVRSATDRSSAAKGRCSSSFVIARSNSSSRAEARNRRASS